MLFSEKAERIIGIVWFVGINALIMVIMAAQILRD